MLRTISAATATSTWTSSRTRIRAQYELVRLLAAAQPETPGHMNVCAVADDDQCLVAGTRITMADGSQRAIEDVVAGDSVLSAIWQRRLPARACALIGAT